jgi:hypothetical protein
MDESFCTFVNSLQLFRDLNLRSNYQVDKIIASLTLFQKAGRRLTAFSSYHFLFQGEGVLEIYIKNS